MDGLRLVLLGGFELHCGERVVLDRTWTRSRAKALLKLVALERQVHRERVLDLLWPDLDAHAAGANLRKNLHHLRGALAAGGVSAEVVTVRDDLVSLGPGVRVDVEEFRALAEAGLRGADPRAVDAALAGYPGDLLPEDRFEEWAARPRLELRRLRARLLVEGARRDDAAGLLPRAIRRLEQALETDPLDEEVHRALIEAYLRSGSRHRALRQFRDCARVLRAELGVDPSAQMCALQDAVLAGTDIPRAARAPQPALFGRDRELERAVDVLDAVRAGRGGTLVIGGVAGSGKSRLVAEVAVAAADSGARVATGHCYDLEAGIAYQPVREALGELAADPDIAAAVRHTVYTKRLLPGAPVGPVPVADPLLLEAELIDETVHLLVRLAGARPLVLVVEDLQVADQATIRLLHVLGRRLTGCAGLLVLTARGEEVVAGSPADRLVVGLRRHGGSCEIDLEPLADAALELLVRERFGPEPVDPTLLREIVEASEGIPLFAGELVETLRETGAVRPTGGRWRVTAPAHRPTPTAVRELVGQRLTPLDRGTQRVLAVASVLGRAFDVQLLAHAAGAGLDDVLDALDRAIDGALVAEDGDGYRFRHELVRAAVYDGVTGVRRRRLHRDVADAMIALRDTDGAGHHLALGDQPWRAVPFLAEEARGAAALFANATARAWYEQALTIAREHDDRIDPRLHAELLEELGDLILRTGDAEAGVRHLREALERYQILDDKAAVLRTRGKAALGHVVVGEVEAASELVQSLTAAWEELLAKEGPDLVVLAPSGAFTTLADIRWHTGQHEGALAAADRAVRLAESGGDRAERARAYECFALACHSLGDWRRGMDYELQRAALGLPGFSDVILDAHY